MPWWKRLSSPFVSWVVESRTGALGVPLEVIYCNGRYQLDTERVNYSFGELHTAFADTFAKLEVYARQPERVLVLGLGVGSIPHLLQKVQPPPHIIGVELDAEVLALGHTYFGLDGYPQLQIRHQDAAAYVIGCTETFDLVCVDVFLDDRVPAHLHTLPMLKALYAAIAPGRLLIWNRLVHDAQTAADTAAFQQLFAVVFPGHRVHRVADNHMYWFVKPK
jgi:spermidine synthase